MFKDGPSLLPPPSHRYIFTRLTPIARALFPEADDSLLEYLEEDGQTVEPRFFIPVLPALLLNGSKGIGTGWSTVVPSYNALEIVNHLVKRIRGQDTGTPYSNTTPINPTSPHFPSYLSPLVSPPSLSIYPPLYLLPPQVPHCCHGSKDSKGH